MFRKFTILFCGVTCGLILVVLIGAWGLGAFSTVELAQEELGPYRIVCLDHTGPYHKISDLIREVRELLKGSEDRVGMACALYYDNPEEVEAENLRSKGGFVLEGDVEVKEPLRIERVPRRTVLVARVEAHPSIAALKVYPRMAEWMSANRMAAAGPALELYQKGRVEIQIPIRPVVE